MRRKHQPVNVVCRSRQENRLMLQSLRDRGFTFADGQAVDPDNIRYTSKFKTDDDVEIPTACYAVHEQLREVAFNNHMSMMLSHAQGNETVSLPKYLERCDSANKR